ncbi:MAG: hypothetical protein ACXACB_13545, partial [Promethearchaeota archaeon]
MRSKAIKNDLRKWIPFSLLLCIVASFTFLPFNDLQSTTLKEQLEDLNIIEFPRVASEYTGIGLARNATEFGEGSFQNYNLNISNNDNASIIVPDGWGAKEITSNITKIYEYNTQLLNSTFDTGYDSNFWTNYISDPSRAQNVTFNWYNAPSGRNDSIYIRFNETNDGGENWNNVYSYWNYTFDLPRDQIPFEDWEITYNYRVLFNNSDWLPGTGGAAHTLNVYVNGVNQEFSQGKLSNLIPNNNTWLQGGATFQSETYNFILPGTISLLFGIDFGQTTINPTGWLEMYYDNITLKISTIPKPSQINLTINDTSNNNNVNYNDVNGYGLGTANLQNTWSGDVGGKSHFFTFLSNSSGDLIIDADFYVKAKSSQKTSTQLGDEGAEFVVENHTEVIWTTYYSINTPGSYSDNYYFNVSKPINWNVTQLIDPYGNDKISDVVETAGYGNTSLRIPESIVSNGLWKIVAESPNYVKETNIYRKELADWELNSTFQVFDRLKINGSIRTSLIPNPDLTNVSFSIFYPNGTLWFQEGNLSIDINGKFNLPEITLGPNNASAGNYNLHLHWSNYNVNMSQVGLSIVNFALYHDTKLTRENSHSSINIPAFSGDTILIKVNYTDTDTNKEIASATVNYTVDNATKITGIMVYQGGGIYFAEIHTTGLQIGVYNVTISAIKSYYEAQNRLKLFELELQLYTTLERYESPTFVEFSNNATVKFRYQDSFGIGITGAIIKVNIDQEYIISIDEEGEGNYAIKFNTGIFSPLGKHIITF